MPNDLNWIGEDERVLMLNRVKKDIDNKIRRKRTFRLWSLYSAVASIILVGGLSLLIKKEDTVINKKEVILISDVAHDAPEGVTLTLADGSVLDETSLKEGTVKQVKGLVIRRLATGEMSYEYTKQQSTSAKSLVANNTIHIPNGSKIQLTLIDGTKVWLNTGSKLTYPLEFHGQERKVTLDGEGYFEVAHNKKKPFTVVANGAEILVTGTHFNVSAYHTDKTIRTTLLEGGVEVKQEGKEVILTPGFEAIANADGSKLLKQRGNVEQAMAWKNGYFVFDDMDIVSVMRSVARWYDITVKAEGKVPTKIIGGTFPVTANLDELLKDLGKIADIKFKRNGKEVIIE